MELQLSQETYRIHIYREILKKTKHNTDTAQHNSQRLNLTLLTFYFIFHWQSPPQSKKEKRDCLFCLLGNAGVIHRHPDPEESKQSCISLRMAVAWCYTNSKNVKKKKNIYILGVDWVSVSTEHSSTIEQSEERERREEREREREKGRPLTTLLPLRAPSSSSLVSPHKHTHTFPVFLVVAVPAACSKMTNTAARRRCAHVPPVNRRPNFPFLPPPPPPRAAGPSGSSQLAPHLYCCTFSPIIPLLSLSRIRTRLLLLDAPGRDASLSLSMQSAEKSAQPFKEGEKDSKKRRKTTGLSPSAANWKLSPALFAVVYHVYPNTPTPPLLHCVCHAGASQYCQCAPLHTDSRVHAAMRGWDLAKVSQGSGRGGFSFSFFFCCCCRSSGTFGAIGGWGGGGWVLLCGSGSSCASCPWLRTCSAAEKKAPLPPLCIMTNQGRQAAVPLAHHSTVSLPRESKLTKLTCGRGPTLS